MSPGRAINEARRLIDMESAEGACALARMAIERALNRLAQPKRRPVHQLSQIITDLQRDDAIDTTLMKELHRVCQALSGVLHGGGSSVKKAGILVEKAAILAARLEMVQPAHYAWRRGVEESGRRRATQRCEVRQEAMA